jgi:hypothetical protein
VLVGIIALMMEAASTSETSVNLYQTTRRNNLEDSHIQCSEENFNYTTITSVTVVIGTRVFTKLLWYSIFSFEGSLNYTYVIAA